MINREQKCPFFDLHCKCLTVTCRVRLPDEGCYWYRWFKELIEEDNKNKEEINENKNTY